MDTRRYTEGEDEEPAESMANPCKTQAHRKLDLAASEHLNHCNSRLPECHWSDRVLSLKLRICRFIGDKGFRSRLIRVIRLAA